MWTHINMHQFWARGWNTVFVRANINMITVNSFIQQNKEQNIVEELSEDRLRHAPSNPKTSAASGVARGGGGRGAAAVEAPPQTPGRLRRKNVAGASARRPPPERGFGRSLSGGLGAEPQRGSGGRAHSIILAAKPSRGLGRSPNRRGPPGPPSGCATVTTSYRYF